MSTMEKRNYGGILGSLRKRIPDGCGLYDYSRENIPASYWNNPHVCYDKEKLLPAKLPQKRMPKRQTPRWEVRKPILERSRLKQEKMNEIQSRFKRLKAMKYALPVSAKPVDGRQNVSLQTCDYLEALYDEPPKFNACTQTSMERPSTPPFIPAKTGIDMCTQIYPDDLFFFDEEVKPILEVTTGRTVEQALLEVLHEDEIEGMEMERRRFLDEKSAKTAEVSRIEEEERRRMEETDQRIVNQQQAKDKQKALEKKIAAAMVNDEVCRELLPKVLEDMTAQGYYVDATEEAVQDVMKLVEEDVMEELKRIAVSEDVLSEMIKEVVQERYDVYRELGEHPVERFGLEPEEALEEMEEEAEIELEVQD